METKRFLEIFFKLTELIGLLPDSASPNRAALLDVAGGLNQDHQDSLLNDNFLDILKVYNKLGKVK